MASDFTNFNAGCHGAVPLETAIYSEDTSLDRVDSSWSTKSRAIPKNLAPCGQVRTLLDNLTGEAFASGPDTHRRRRHPPPTSYPHFHSYPQGRNCTV